MASDAKSTPTAATETESDFLSLPSLADDEPDTASRLTATATPSDSKQQSAAPPGATADGTAGAPVAASSAVTSAVAASRFRKATLTDHLPTRFLYIANCGSGRGDSEEQMRAVFARYGRIQTVVLPAQKPFCVICFATPAEAERAMKWPTATQLGNRIIKMNYACIRENSTAATAAALTGDGMTARKQFAAVSGTAASAEELVKQSLLSAADAKTGTGKKGRRRAAAAAGEGDDGSGEDESFDWLSDETNGGGGTSKHQFASLPCTSSTEHVHVPGLHVIPDFISHAEEEAVMRAIDASKWIHPPHAHKMGRRVQHYGYAFDYESRTVDPTKHIGPLPDWFIGTISKRLAQHNDLIRSPLPNATAAAAATATAASAPIASASASSSSPTADAKSAAAATTATASSDAGGGGGSVWVPDQLTINEYMPGQGIRPHIDTHSAFEDPIISVSLSAHTVMDIRLPQPSKVVKHIHLPPRSALVLSGAARFLWSHGIARRKNDCIPVRALSTSATPSNDAKSAPTTAAAPPAAATKQEITIAGVATPVTVNIPAGSTLVKRERRVSLTLRKVRKQQTCDCEYHDQCDTYAKKRVAQPIALAMPRSSAEAEAYEREHVHAVYDAIATHFSHTRHSPWPSVEAFLLGLPVGSRVADVGCGNGKYLAINPKLKMMGCDISSNLVAICRERGFKDVVVGDALAVPFPSDSFDAAISIAVLHHISTVERRVQAIRELLRVIKVGGQALICAWAQEQDSDSRFVFAAPDVFVPWNLPQHHAAARAVGGDAKSTAATAATAAPAATPSAASTATAASSLASSAGDVKSDSAVAAVKGKPGSVPYTVFNRYCHVYSRDELSGLVRTHLPHAKVVKEYFDRGNWCILIERTK